MSGFYKNIALVDSAVSDAMDKELFRQQNEIELIASENFASKAVMEAQGSIMTNKYAEGYPGRRYYNGCDYVDLAENLAIERICKLFGCKYANVQPHSGSQANQTVFLSLLEPGDTILGMSIDSGGHLTHGHKVNMSGKWLNAVSYNVDKESYLIDMDEVRDLAKTHNPKLIIAGASAYSRHIDFAKFKEIADEVGAIFLADIAHYSGLIVSDCYPNPFPHADIVTSTTHKTLRGPRGGIVLTNDDELIKKINRSLFPGLQGGPLMHAIAAKAVAFGEALSQEFKDYSKNVLENARILSKTLQDGGVSVVTGGTDSHMILVDLRDKGVTGLAASDALHHAGITCNKNGVPFDEASPMVTSGIRIGTPACTTRGFMGEEFQQVGSMILEVIEKLAQGQEPDAKKINVQVRELCARFPLYA